MKPRDPARHDVAAAPAETKRAMPWRKAAGVGAGKGAAGASGAPATAAGALSRFTRRDRTTDSDSDGGTDSGTRGGRSGIPKVQPPFAGGGAGGGRGGESAPMRGPFSGIDLIMLIPAALAAWFGAGLFVSCAEEAGGRAAFYLWLMMGFWIVIISAKWPLLRLMRWAWVLAGLMAAASIPIGGG
jgi:hypothetical protein